MSFDQFAESYFLNKIRQQLRGYGLNPRDWRVSLATVDDYLRIEMVHKNDENFRLNGAVDRKPNGDVKLSHLSLMSL